MTYTAQEFRDLAFAQAAMAGRALVVERGCDCVCKARIEAIGHSTMLHST